MTKVFLLKELKAFAEEKTKDIILPVRMQEDDEEPPKPRAADIYMMRLISSSAAQKVAPYIIHQVITGRDAQLSGQRVSGSTVVRTIFSVYNEDEQEGSLMLLNLIERLRISLLEQITIVDQYQLDLQDGLDILIYNEDTWPYYAGEMISTWIMPSVERNVRKYVT